MTMITVDPSELNRPKLVKHGHERAEYRFYYAIAYGFCFVGAIGARLIGHRSKTHPTRSVFGDASASADSIIPWIFAGR